ncbi:MAG TPA: hypothetical protein VK459_19505, partial [Polyangiaceae bacterium]|nr:hypothetical protein [Polyangiaceae bacterium]
MSLHNPEEILKLHRVALSFHLEDARDALLEGIDPAVVSELPKGLAPSDQILSDLTELNRIGRLDDGSIPLEIWILNAVSLVPRAAAAAFFEALNALPRELARP